MEQQAVVVGGGQAAAQAFVGLRVEGDSGRIVRVGTEAVLPYLRPPLSKADLAGQVACARRLLRPPARHEQQRVAMHPDVSVTGVRMAERKAESSDGRVPDFDRLVFATVGRPRRLKCPDGEHSGLYRFRDMAGVPTIHPQLKAGARRGLIGGGYIGLEIPAVASKMGLKVAALEAMPPLLARVTCVDVATFYRCEHERHGGDIRCNATGSGIDGSDEKPQLMTQDGGVVEAALVIPGIGLLPNIELAEQSGLSCDNGILVDDRCRTSVDGIDAAGDGTQHPSAVYDAMLRLESAPNAIALSRASRSRRRSAARPNPIGRRPGSGRSSATASRRPPDSTAATITRCCAVNGNRARSSHSICGRGASRSRCDQPACRIHSVQNLDRRCIHSAEAPACRGDHPAQLNSPEEKRATSQGSDEQHAEPCQSIERTMANINFVENDGSQHEVDAADNFSLAEFATSTLISGIDADCSCGICHVHIDAPWLSKLEAKNDRARQMPEVPEVSTLGDASPRLSSPIKMCAPRARHGRAYTGRPALTRPDL